VLLQQVIGVHIELVVAEMLEFLQLAGAIIPAVEGGLG